MCAVVIWWMNQLWLSHGSETLEQSKMLVCGAAQDLFFYSWKLMSLRWLNAELNIKYEQHIIKLV